MMVSGLLWRLLLVCPVTCPFSLGMAVTTVTSIKTATTTAAAAVATATTTKLKEVTLYVMNKAWMLLS